MTPSGWTRATPSASGASPPLPRAARLRAVPAKTRWVRCWATTRAACLGTLLGGSASAAIPRAASTDTVTQLLELFLSNRSVVTGDKDSSWVDESLVRGSIAAYQANNAGFANLMLTYKGDVPTLVLTEEQWSSVVTLEQNVYVDDGDGLYRPRPRQRCRLRRGQRSDHGVRRHMAVAQRADRSLLSRQRGSGGRQLYDPRPRARDAQRHATASRSLGVLDGPRFADDRHLDLAG